MCGPQSAAIDGCIYERYDTSRVRIWAIGADSSQLLEFRDVFGMRFTGLIDPSSNVYRAWRVPNPTAPYPQDYIIDQEGVVRYWSDQFDPRAVIATIDRLLATGLSEGTHSRYHCSALGIRPTVCNRQVTFRLSPAVRPEPGVLRIYSASGRLVTTISSQSESVGWNMADNDGRIVPAGVYVARFGNASGRFVVLE